MRGTTWRRVAWTLGLVAIASCLAAAPLRAASAVPEGKPVTWDQARVTKYAVDLDDAVEDAVTALAKNPMQSTPKERIIWYQLKDDLRLISDSTAHLKSELQAGSGAEETSATFDRIETLRRDAEELGRKSMIPAPVMDALVKAGSIHNLMMPYYHGKR